MSVGGLCQICESASAENQCTRCGMLVCDDHYNPTRMLCVDCTADIEGTGDVLRR